MTDLQADLRAIADGYTLGRRSREHDYRAIKGLRQAANEIERLSASNARLRDVLTWSEQNCPGKCAGPIRKSLTTAERADG